MERTVRKSYIRWKDMLCDNIADFYGDGNVSDLLDDLECFKRKYRTFYKADTDKIYEYFVIAGNLETDSMVIEELIADYGYQSSGTVWESYVKAMARLLKYIDNVGKYYERFSDIRKDEVIWDDEEAVHDTD